MSRGLEERKSKRMWIMISNCVGLFYQKVKKVALEVHPSQSYLFLFLAVIFLDITSMSERWGMGAMSCCNRPHNAMSFLVEIPRLEKSQDIISRKTPFLTWLFRLNESQHQMNLAFHTLSAHVREQLRPRLRLWPSNSQPCETSGESWIIEQWLHQPSDVSLVLHTVHSVSSVGSYA